MLSYQHGYHAGGPADIHKHLALAGLLNRLAQARQALSYLESHAGRGLYDLASAMAAKTGEAARGLARLRRSDHPFWRALDLALAELGPDAYPGSPAIARLLLRPQDRMTLFELHPTEHAALRAALAAPGTAIHRRDGHAALRALPRPEPRAGLALLDPSYEVKTEYAETAETALTLAARWPEGAILVWYPLLPDARHAALCDAVTQARPDALRDEAAFAERPARGMTGSGLLLINPPDGAAETLAEARAAAAPVLI